MSNHFIISKAPDVTIPIILFLMLNSVIGCRKNESEYCDQYLGSWHFHYSLSKTSFGPVAIYSGESSEYEGYITKGTKANAINVIFSPTSSRTDLKVGADGNISNTCGLEAPLHWSIYCSGFFEGDSIFHYTNYEKSPPNHSVETIIEITGLRSGRNIQGNAPAIFTGNPSNLTTSTVTLNGTVNPNYLPTYVSFQYGPGDGSYYIIRQADEGIISGSGEKNMSLSLTGLYPGITFHYRIKASNAYGINYGSDMAFTTLE